MQAIPIKARTVVSQTQDELTWRVDQANNAPANYGGDGLDDRAERRTKETLHLLRPVRNVTGDSSGLSSA